MVSEEESWINLLFISSRIKNKLYKIIILTLLLPLMGQTLCNQSYPGQYHSC